MVLTFWNSMKLSSDQNLALEALALPGLCVMWPHLVKKKQRWFSSAVLDAKSLDHGLIPFASDCHYNAIFIYKIY